MLSSKVRGVVRALTMLLLMSSMVAPGRAQDREPRQRGDAAREDVGVPIPPETNSTTKHELTLAGQLIRYTATAGNLLIRDDPRYPALLAEIHDPPPLLYVRGSLPPELASAALAEEVRVLPADEVDAVIEPSELLPDTWNLPG